MNPFSKLALWLGSFPVKVLKGPLRGLWWSAYPFSSYWRGNYEPAMTKEILARLKPGNSAWDIGAHFGYYTLLMGRIVGENGNVVALEPYLPARLKLQRHLRLNGMKNTRVFPYAASAAGGAATLWHYPDSASTEAHLPYPGETDDPNAERFQVTTVCFDDLKETEKLPPPQLIKIDVEGHAAEVLQGASKTPKDGFPVLLVAFHSDGEWEGVLKILRPLGYKSRCLSLREDADGKPYPGDYVFEIPNAAH